MKIQKCENCKWCKITDEDPLGIAGGSCLHYFCKKMNREIDDNPQAVCEIYKRKWWKFWAKK
jgi:hypothetical protein